MRVSEIRVNQIRVNQGLGVYFCSKTSPKKSGSFFLTFTSFQVIHQKVPLSNSQT